MNTTQNVHSWSAQNYVKRFDEIGWGIFLMMTVIIWLVPSVPPGTWLIGTGVLLLGLNVVLYKTWAQWNGFTTALGAFALAAGVSELIGIKLPLFAICLVVIRASMLFKPFWRKDNHQADDSGPLTCPHRK